ncbi:MAG: GNAT family N-acetyltransferase [Anaerolineaceae bacterium]
MDLTNIFEGERLCLTEINPKEDAEKDALWSHAIEYARARKKNPVRPISVLESRKSLEEELKEAENEGDRFHFAIRSKDEKEGLLGFLDVVNIEWKNGQGFIQILLGNEEISKEYLAESLQLGLRYIFDELNLYHVCVEVPAYEAAIIVVFEKAGFMHEACLREIIFHEGKYHDRILFGLLAEEWRMQKGLK